jgi:hypothetical protein
MIAKKSAPPGAKLVPHEYSFLKPAKLRIRNVDGTERLVGYGIGERISVLEPSIQFLVASHEMLEEVPLEDGSFIVEWPSNVSLTYVW